MTHPDDERIALFAEGRLPRQQAAEILDHLAGCDPCLRAVRGANESRLERVAAAGPAMGVRLWLAAAAMIALVLAGLVILQARRAGTPMQRLVALAPRDARGIEPRLSGGFPWAPYRGPMRATDGAARNYRLIGAAGEILDDAERSQSTEMQQAAGDALVFLDRPQDAVPKLRTAAEREPSNAALWNDLGSADYAAAMRFDQPSRLPEALAAFDRALSIDPRRAEVLFNRALTLQRLGLHVAAREAWQRYLAIDGTSSWADEARNHLRTLPSSTGQSRFRGDEPRLESAAERGDRDAVDAWVRRYPQAARTFAEAEYLAQWAASGSPKRLVITRMIGDSLARISGELLLHDAVDAIDRADAPARRALAEAQLVYRRGRLAYSHQSPAAAEPDLRHSAERFAAHGSPLALVARYYAANTRFDQNDVAGARQELEALLADLELHPAYKALGAQTRWELALCMMNDDDWIGALPHIIASRQAFDALGERQNRGFMDAMEADALLSLGRPDEAWTARIHAFDALGSEGWGDRLAVSISGAARMELRAGRLAAARALSALELDALRPTGNDSTLANALVRAAVLDARLGDRRSGMADVQAATLAASRLTDPAMRARSLVDVDFAHGAVLLNNDARAAAAMLDRALRGYEQVEAPVFLPETCLLRAQAARKLGDRDGALRQIARGIAAYERHHEASVLDAGRALYEEAIRLALDAGESAAAFAWSERALGAHAEELPVVQERLRGTGAAILDLAVARGEVVAFLIRAEAVDIIGPVGPYDELLPRLPLRGITQLIIVADSRLEGLSEVAPRLVDRVAVSFAPDASGLRRAAPPRPSSIVAFAADGRDLPGSREELAELAHLYPRQVETRDTFASLLAAKADVIHISGHAQGGNDATIALQGDRVSARRIASCRLRGAPLVVLAACDTLRASRSPLRRSLSLGEGFLAAGAAGVIGTFGPIPDNDARTIFSRIHHHLAEGHSAAQAVRLAQREAMTTASNGAWRSIALLTRTIDVRKESF